MSDNWVVQNLQNALETWNSKFAEIWTLLTQSPENFKGGAIWQVILSIHGALQAIGYALLVLFFVVGVVKTCGSLTEVKKPEHALKLFIRFALAKGVITYGLELMLKLMVIVQGVISKIMTASGIANYFKRDNNIHYRFVKKRGMALKPYPSFLMYDFRVDFRVDFVLTFAIILLIC